ncbi:hypothetical protein N8381_00750 [Oceanospirillaceae bacterium]|jgi:hypothetical protein|nr:hypothetical protein [Oceanospirillaceae bacterium]
MSKPAISFATGEQIKTGSNSESYRTGWDEIFNKQNKDKSDEPKAAERIDDE